MGLILGNDKRDSIYDYRKKKDRRKENLEVSDEKRKTDRRKEDQKIFHK